MQKTSTEGNRIYEWDDEPALFIAEPHVKLNKN